MDSRKRTRCKICKKRVNLAWKKENGRFYSFCPNCGAHGDIRLKKVRITKKLQTRFIKK